MVLNPLAWGRNAKGKAKELHGSVLDMPVSQYDAKTGLPKHIQVGCYQVSPVVTLEQVHDHLVILGAFQELAQQSGAHFHRLADSAAFEYERWAQTVLPYRPFKAASGSSSPTHDAPQTPLSPVSDTSFVSSVSASSSSSSQTTTRPLTVEELPPLPVLMCWHAHLLNPAQYAHDTDGLYAFLHNLPFPFAQTAAAIRAGNTLPTEVEHVPLDGGALRPIPSISGWTPVDISAAVQRQARIVTGLFNEGWLNPSFVSGPEETFQRAIVRYHAWLDLMAAAHTWVAPTFDIEFVWHTHQLSGARYQKETQRILGRPLDMSGRIDEVSLKRAAGLWRQRFKHEYLLHPAHARLGPLIPNKLHLGPGLKLGHLGPQRRSTVP